jgi:hypothetical protein
MGHAQSRIVYERWTALERASSVDTPTLVAVPVCDSQGLADKRLHVSCARIYSKSKIRQ